MINIIRDKKGQEEGGLGMNQIVIIILVVLVIVAVLMFLYKGDITRYISNLPGYGYAEDRVVDLSNLPEDIQKKVGLCPYQIGDVRTERDWTYFGTTSYIYLNGKGTDLIWDSNNKAITVHRMILPNYDIGKIDSFNGVTIGQEWFSSKSSGLPSSEQLRLLDGSYKLWGGNKICRQKQP